MVGRELDIGILLFNVTGHVTGNIILQNPERFVKHFFATGRKLGYFAQALELKCGFGGPIPSFVAVAG
jgi:hypothetical protein